jgi:hypothetical protein
MWAHRAAWKWDQPFLIAPNYFDTVKAPGLELFLKHLAASPEELTTMLAAENSEWDFLALQQRPIVQFESGELLLLDEGYLIDRITKGLFWLVHDHERSTQGDKGREAWNRAYGEMVELMAEDIIQPMEPPLLGGGSTYYDEEQFGKAYKSKKADAGVDFGKHMVLFEVVSGHLTTKTRIQGDLLSFKKDTEKLVLKKVRQLDGLRARANRRPPNVVKRSTGEE